MGGETLFPYQLEGIEWLSKRKVALLSDEMGLGKSAQSIIAADKINAKRILVVCPAVARDNWLREFTKFSSLQRDFIIIRSSKDKMDQLKSVITSYDLLSRIGPDAYGQFDLIILDEIHYTKSVSAKRTHAVFGKAGIIHGQKQSKTNGINNSVNKQCRTWCLSGTPAPNHAGELWPLLFSFGATSLNYDDFIQRLCLFFKNPFGNKIQITGTRKERIPELRGLLAKVMLRRTKDQVGHMLPKIFYSDVVVEAGAVDLETSASFIQYVFPKNRVDELEAKLKAEVQLVNKAINHKDIKVLEGLAKSVSTLRRYVGIQKVEKVAELVAQELESKLYDKIVIFAIHRDVIEGLRVRLKDFGALTLYGGTKFDSAHRNIDKFQQQSKFKVFIGNITACGIAINLTAAHNVLMIEQEWTPASNAQAIARCHRHGQLKPVTVRVVGLANSLDEKVANILRKKTNELTSIFDKTNNFETATFEDLIK